MTLGQGPCEYVLDLEGVRPRSTGGTRDTLGATCGIWNGHLKCFADAVDGKAVKYKYKGKILEPVKPGERFPPELEERLVQAVEDLLLFVTEVNKRMHEYRDFSDRMAAFCEKESSGSPQVKALADKVLEKAKQFQGKCHDANTQEMDKQWAEWNVTIPKILEEVKAGKYDNIRKGGKIRDYAESQDIFIANARLFVKAMREEVSAVESDDPEAVKFAVKVRDLCHDVLRRKHSMESW
jgi:hypothetical protein